MAKRRKQIAMSTEEQAAYLESGRTLQFATVGHDGYPHLTALWYAVLDGRIYFNTYGTSQKSLNMERDPRVTCMIESGTEYAQLKGLVVQGRVQVVDDPDVLRAFADEITRRYPTRRGAVANATDGERNATARARFAAKRNIYAVTPQKVYSWDHSKLSAGVY